jgi:hypothetical protein
MKYYEFEELLVYNGVYPESLSHFNKLDNLLDELRTVDYLKLSLISQNLTLKQFRSYNLILRCDCWVCNIEYIISITTKQFVNLLFSKDFKIFNRKISALGVNVKNVNKVIIFYAGLEDKCKKKCRWYNGYFNDSDDDENYYHISRPLIINSFED